MTSVDLPMAVALIKLRNHDPDESQRSKDIIDWVTQWVNSFGDKQEDANPTNRFQNVLNSLKTTIDLDMLKELLKEASNEEDLTALLESFQSNRSKSITQKQLFELFTVFLETDGDDDFTTSKLSCIAQMITQCQEEDFGDELVKILEKLVETELKNNENLLKSKNAYVEMFHQTQKLEKYQNCLVSIPPLPKKALLMVVNFILSKLSYNKDELHNYILAALIIINMNSKVLNRVP